jgi:hypothetical protein
LFFLLITAQLLIYNYPYSLKLNPRNHHNFRQYDCLSFALNFYSDRGSLIEPRLNNLGEANNGKAATEFPLVQYLIGKIWKITGVNVTVYRLTNLLFLIIGLFFLYKLFLLEFKSKTIAALISSLLFTSPILAYYGNSCISDIQSLSLSLVGCFYYFNWSRTKKLKSFYLFGIIFLIAGLLKISSVMLFLICILHFIFKNQSESKKSNKWVYFNLNYLISLSVPVLVWLIWYSYVKNYNLKNNNSFFLIGILPIWEATPEELTTVITAFVYNIFPSILNPTLLVLMTVFIITSFFYFQARYKAYIVLSCICVSFFLAYFILFFKVLDIHDYYMLNMLGIISIALFFIAKINKTHVLRFKKIILFNLSLFVVINTYLTSIKTWKKINYNETDTETALVFNHEEIRAFKFFYWNDKKKHHVFEKNLPALESIGISKNDTILCIGDYTINRTLFLLRRLGYTDFNRSGQNLSEFLKNRPQIKYIVCIEPELLEKEDIKVQTTNKIFERENLSIFKVK